MKKISLFLFIIVSLMSFSVIAFAETVEIAGEEFYTGLEEMTQEELEEFHDTLPKIVDVKPNNIALSRLTEDEAALFENIEVAELGEEMVYAIGDDASELMENSEFLLTSAVDVSQAATFPPIGDQGETNACVPWTLCYYQMTNNTNLVRGLQAKTEEGTIIPESVMAPGFVYSLCNGGLNSSTNWIEVAEALVGYGCPNISSYGLEITAENLKKWCTDTAIWYEAMYNKPAGMTYMEIDVSQTINRDSNCVQLIKRTLSNGYVVSFSTFANSYEVTRDTSNGEYACRYMTNAKSGGHAMTIVGYDDGFWVDINGNKEEDEGEKGAFKIVNSWGTWEPNGWYDEFASGYIWMPYDAMGKISGVEMAPSNRMPIMKEAVYFLAPQKNYIPLIVSEVEIITAKRNDIIVSLGVSDIESKEPEFYVSPIPNSNKCAAFYKAAQGKRTGQCNSSYSGGENMESAIIPFDLTNAVKKIYNDYQVDISEELRFYVKIEDCNNDDEYAVILGDVVLVEPLTGKRINCLATANLTAGTSGVVKNIDFELTAYVGHCKKQDICIEFNSSICKETLKDNVYMISPEGDNLYLECEVEGARVVLLAPENGYEDDSKYELHIESGVRSLGGNALQDEYVMPVYMLGDLFYNDMAKLEIEVEK